MSKHATVAQLWAGWFVLAALGGCGQPPGTNAAPSSVTPRRTRAAEEAWKRLVDAWEYPNPIPDFELTDQNGKKFRLGSLGSGYLFVSFAFSHCQVVKACPTTMKKTREVQELWAERIASGNTNGRSLHLLTCTLDPENDTPARLREYGQANGADFASWTLATGPAGLMEQGLPSLFGVMAMRDRKGTLNHGVKAALLAPGLRSIREWDDNDFDPEDVIKTVLAHESRPESPPP